jgi:hypothetical protein
MNKAEPAFKSIFGSAWDALPPVFKKRYMNRSYSNDISTVEGTMDIHFSKFMAFFMPIFRLFHVLVPYAGNNIPVKVDFRSEMDSDGIWLYRKFYFPNKQPYEFNSRMQIIKNNEVVERMAFGFGWRTHYFYDGKKLIMQHKAYVIKIFGVYIPMPFEMIIGKGYAEETVIDDNTYKVDMIISHPWFGTMYRYEGNFHFTRLSS